MIQKSDDQRMLVLENQKRQECGVGPSGGAAQNSKSSYIGHDKENYQ